MDGGCCLRLEATNEITFLSVKFDSKFLMALFVLVEVGTDDGGEQAAGRVNLKERKKEAGSTHM